MSNHDQQCEMSKNITGLCECRERTYKSKCETLESQLSIAVKALEKVDIYFKALCEQWVANDGRVVSESGVIIDASADCERLCEEAGSAVANALSQIKSQSTIRGKGC